MLWLSIKIARVCEKNKVSKSQHSENDYQLLLTTYSHSDAPLYPCPGLRLARFGSRLDRLVRCRVHETLAFRFTVVLTLTERVIAHLSKTLNIEYVENKHCSDKRFCPARRRVLHVL